MPRKNHVNKDGSTHARWGKRTAKITQVESSLLDAPRRRGRPKKGEESTEKRWTTKLVNKGTEKCPRCDFPEAYGGYCDECGWSAPVVVDGVVRLPSAPRKGKTPA